MAGPGKEKKVQNHRYYVAVKDTILSRLKGECDMNIAKLKKGMLLEVIDIEKDGSVRVQVHHKSEPQWNLTEWKGHLIDLVSISNRIWNLLLSVPSLTERYRLVNNKQFIKDVDELSCNSKIWYCEENLETFQAVVKYIGPVPELGEGHYFGLDIELGLYKIDRTEEKYNNSNSFTTLSYINPRKTGSLEDIKKFEEKFLSNDIRSTANDSLFTSTTRVTSDISKKKENTYNIAKSNFFDTHNNNNNNPYGESVKVAANNANLSKNSICMQQQNENRKLYSNLKDFDPLVSDDDQDQRDLTQKLNGEILKPLHSTNGDLNIGSHVKVVAADNDTLYGVIRWIGTHPGTSSDKIMAAIELHDNHPLGTDGTYKNTKYFDCDPQKAYFTDIKDCYEFDMATSSDNLKDTSDLECLKSSIIKGAIPPIIVNRDLDRICGKYRGIQGHHNSCYLDATLFSMFAFTSVFDSLLFRPPNSKDCPEYDEVQRVLREEIVNPLRKDLFVGADHVMKLRTLLEKLSSISGLTSEEKDPEEFLTSLVAQILNAEPFLKLSSGQEAYHYQLFVEKDDRLTLPAVQQLLEQSFFTSNIRLKEVPSCLIIQMPRFGKSYKMYPKIQPTLLLDVTDIIEDSPRQCTVCGCSAEFECKECYAISKSLEDVAFCKECFDKKHRHEDRKNHEKKKLNIPLEFQILKDQSAVPRLYLELLAVVCIETSHYVSFVKCGPGSDAPWCFFDSMADRKGEQNGYNIPEMVPCPDFPFWLSEEGANSLNKMTDDQKLPEHAKRLLCDAYMCMYQSLDVMMYK